MTSMSLILLFFLCVIGAGISAYMLDLGKAGRNYRRIQAKKQLEHELQTLLSNPSLCSAMTVAGATFTTPTLAANSTFRNLVVIDSLKLANSSVVGADTKADFVITGHDTQNVSNVATAKVTALFQTAGSNISTCKLYIDTQTACQEAGLTWITADNRCGICEGMGGIWASGTCTL